MASSIGSKTQPRCGRCCSEAFSSLLIACHTRRIKMATLIITFAVGLSMLFGGVVFHLTSATWTHFTVRSHSLMAERSSLRQVHYRRWQHSELDLSETPRESCCTTEEATLDVSTAAETLRNATSGRQIFRVIRWSKRTGTKNSAARRIQSMDAARGGSRPAIAGLLNPATDFQLGILKGKSLSSFTWRLGMFTPSSPKEAPTTSPGAVALSGRAISLSAASDFPLTESHSKAAPQGFPIPRTEDASNGVYSTAEGLGSTATLGIVDESKEAPLGEKATVLRNPAARARSAADNVLPPEDGQPGLGSAAPRFTRRPTRWTTASSAVERTVLSSPPPGIAAAENRSADRTRPIEEAFRPLMSAEEKAMLLRTLYILDDRFRGANITFTLYSGALLGARRHRGMIPWDDDIDILVNFSQSRAVVTALALAAGYELYTGFPLRYKFYHRNATAVQGKSWKWPYVDICFYIENDTHIRDNTDVVKGSYTYAKKDVFPVAYRPFDGLSLPVPRDEALVVSTDYDMRVCRTNSFSHRDERYLPTSVAVPCSELYAVYPFVFRNSSSSPVRETVKKGNVTLAEYTVE